MPHAVVAVDERYGAGVDDEVGSGDRIHDPVAYALQVPAQAQHAVRLVAPKVGLHQRVGDEARIGFGHAGAGVDGGGEIDQALNYIAGFKRKFPGENADQKAWLSLLRVLMSSNDFVYVD